MTPLVFFHPKSFYAPAGKPTLEASMLLYSHFNHLSTTAVPTFNLHLVVATAAAATATVVTTIVYCYFCSHCYCALETSHALQDLNSTCSSRSHRHTILYHEVGCKTFSFLLWKKKRIKVTRGCVLENRDRNTKYILRLAATDHFFLLSSCDKKGGTRREKKKAPKDIIIFDCDCTTTWPAAIVSGFPIRLSRSALPDEASGRERPRPRQNSQLGPEIGDQRRPRLLFEVGVTKNHKFGESRWLVHSTRTPSTHMLGPLHSCTEFASPPLSSSHRRAARVTGALLIPDHHIALRPHLSRFCHSTPRVITRVRERNCLCGRRSSPQETALVDINYLPCQIFKRPSKRQSSTSGPTSNTAHSILSRRFGNLTINQILDSNSRQKNCPHLVISPSFSLAIDHHHEPRQHGTAAERPIHSVLNPNARRTV